MASIEPLIPGELALPPPRHHHHHHHDQSSETEDVPLYTPPLRPPKPGGSDSDSDSESERRRRRRTPSATRGAQTSQSKISSKISMAAGSLKARLGLGGVARRTLGIILLLVVVFLWTISNFLASYIFSDGTYSKPFFLVYVNTSCFAFSLIPIAGKYVAKNGWENSRSAAWELWKEIWSREKAGGGNRNTTGARKPAGEDEEVAERLLADDEESLEATDSRRKRREEEGGEEEDEEEEDKLSLRETAWLSLEFCMLWFLANYFASACLEYTSVGSVTILTSTSSIWTLIFGAVMKVEGFTMRKLVGVLASLAGVILISSVDLSGANDDNRGSFPHKSTLEIAIGDSMAFFSAIIYGVYVTVMKKRVGNEDKVDMTLFFGLVGLFNVLFLWPGFFILHYTGIETFELPPTGAVWVIIAVNSIASFFSDIIWAYAMLLTTPLVVTVGLSLNIPLSLIGEMIQYSQYSSWLYWVGAGVVFVSFLFINHESQEEDGADNQHGARGADISMA
ncbi:hypothetical protein QBC42DRAFT_34143 [Cladorrhinum samala]|uniref:EamA domain-containing protein n=1 Tax=Cladorrhinum samala TaxID=585594 RepID=A0AAV9HAY7_9PEZI|nr:hypothetical protein QBC42DRAFT_34143 [Cladorrhinum samala]